MPDRRALIASVHVAAKELGMDEATRRDAMERVTGRRSAADCTDAQLQAILDDFRAKGWTPQRKGRKPSQKPHVRKIFAMWGELKRMGAATSPTPAGFVKRMAQVDDPEFLTADAARPLIEALKSWIEREKRQAAAEARRSAKDGAG